jgi:hypothetical protein
MLPHLYLFTWESRGTNYSLALIGCLFARNPLVLLLGARLLNVCHPNHAACYSIADYIHAASKGDADINQRSEAMPNPLFID